MAGASRKDISGRTVREFESSENVFDIVDAWSRENGYELVEAAEHRLYQKGHNLAVMPMMLSIRPAGGRYRLEAWARAPLINRILALGLLPEEIVVDSGGRKAIIPRKKARGDVNKLLERLGVPPID